MCPNPIPPLRPGRIVTQQQAAGHPQVGVHPRTIRNWISEGFIAGYRVPGVIAVCVDLDEILRELGTNPKMKPSRLDFGPKARIYNAPANRVVSQPVVVHHDEHAT